MPSPLLQLWYAALASDFGIAVSVSNPAEARTALTKAKGEGRDPLLSTISIFPSPHLPSHELWLVKRVQNLTEESADARPDSPILDIDLG